jgi:hypothetical protein
MSAVTTSRARVVRDPIRVPVPKAARSALLIVHIVAIAAWIGLDVALGLLVFVPMAAPEWTAACYQVLPLLFWPLVVAGALSAFSGIALGLVTRWGLVRHWWVAIKIVINAVLVVLVFVLLGPGLDAAGEYGRAVAAGEVPAVEVPRLYMPPIVSTTALVVATALSVVKPKGRLRR